MVDNWGGLCTLTVMTDTPTDVNVNMTERSRGRGLPMSRACQCSQLCAVKIQPDTAAPMKTLAIPIC